MTEFFLEFGLSNALFSVALAIAALAAGAKGKRAGLAHLLWLLVFVKLLTPPVMTVGVIEFPRADVAAVSVMDGSTQGYYHGETVSDGAAAESGGSQSGWLIARTGSVVLEYVRVWLPPIWLAGSLIVLGWSLVRVYRFSCMLSAECQAGSQKLQNSAARIAERLGLKNVPTIYTTGARLTPMVWWSGGKVKVIIPLALLEQMDAVQQELILAHELAHVRRCDHLVRWVEWLACVCFWWNPVVWLAQRNLRAMEEICCDELVVSCLKPGRKFYANTLLSIVEFIAHPAIRPPAMASEINSGGFLERRFRMIITTPQKNVSRRRFQFIVLLVAVIVLPFGFAYGEEKNDRTEAYLDSIWEKLQAQVDAGKMTLDVAEAKMVAIEKNAYSKDKRDVRVVKDVDLDSIAAKIRAAVEAGRITPEEGRAKMEAIRKDGGARGEKEVDLEAIGKRIRAAVQAGKMTAEEGRAKMEAIRSKMGDSDRGEGLRQRYAAAVEEIKAAVEAGKITEEEAKAKYTALRERLAAAHDKKSDVDWDGIIARLKAAVDAGDMTEAEAREKLAGIRRRIAASEKKDVDIDAIAARIRAAVQAGEMTAEEGRAKLAAIRKKMAQGDKGVDLRATYREVAAKTRAAVEAGRMTEEEAKEKLANLRRRIGQAIDDKKKRAGGEQRLDIDAITARIRASVQAGDMTEEEARAKMAAIMERMGQNNRSDVDWEGIKRRIEEAVERGDLTREEANAKYREIRERMAQRENGGDLRAKYAKAAERIRAAVQAGELTEEEARAKLAALRQRIGGADANPERERGSRR